MANKFSRRQFLAAATGASGLVMLTSFEVKKNKHPLSFSTLGCPDWTLDQILNFASANGYDGIEFRGLQRQMDLSKCPEFSKENLASTLQQFKKKKLKIVNLGSSATMHFANPADRKKNMDEGKSFIDLASQLNCPYIRVFPNNLPKDEDKEKTLDRIAEGLVELGNYANDKPVMVLMETHGDVVWTADIEKVMAKANHPKVGLVWDFVNMWSITKEDPQLMYDRLHKYFYHTHIKDFKMVDGKIHYVLLGQGETPIFKAVDLLVKNKYPGYLSFEWEKLWHPEIDAPEIAIADYPKAIKKNIKS